MRHKGTTEKLKEVTGTQKIKETKEETNEREETMEMKTETRESEEVEDEVNKVIDEHTHIELVRDNEVELGECVMTRCEQQDSLLKEQRGTVYPLEADRDEVSPIRPKEVEGMADVNGYTRSFGGKEIRDPLW